MKGYTDNELIRVLLVEDNPADARLVSEIIKDASVESPAPLAFDLTHVKRLHEAIRSLDGGSFDVILLDLDLPDSQGIETFSKMREQASGVPVVVLTGLADETIGVKAIQKGAQDYLIKGVDGSILVRAMRYAIERQRTSRTKAIQKTSETGCPTIEMVGISPEFKEVMRLVSMVAGTSRTSVLIQGETGTGKELIANSIHYQSNRREGPFIMLNCSAIPDTLLETEMFGYEKGAFTDARQSKKGLFELADGGTIFLDEIGDMDIRLQPKLLQMLENRTFRKVGGIRNIHVDVRVIAATNKDLAAMVREKRFRDDLYFRLKVMVINMPPLRERKDDIIPLAEHFLEENSNAFGCKIKRLVSETREILVKYPWPGNVRELKNNIERAFILSDSDEILPEHLPQELISGILAATSQAAFPLTHDMTIEEMERNYIQHVLDRVGGNKTRAAGILGISRLTIREKLKK